MDSDGFGDSLTEVLTRERLREKKRENARRKTAGCSHIPPKPRASYTLR